MNKPFEVCLLSVLPLFHDNKYQEEIPEKVDGKQGLNSPDGEFPYNVGAQIN